MKCKCCGKKIGIFEAIYHYIKFTIWLNIQLRKITKDKNISLKEALEIFNSKR